MTVAIAAAAALIRGGSLSALAALEIRHAWLVFVALVVQVVGITALVPAVRSFDRSLLIATAVPLVVFLVVNAPVPGVVVIGVGFLLNLLVIGMNGAMPVSPSAARSAGVPITQEDQGLRHEISNEHTLLPWLGDVIPVPVLKTVVSLGDVVLAVGVAYLVYRAATSRAGSDEVRRASG